MKLFSSIRSFFRTVVMVHKIVYVRHFNWARKQKKWSVYYISRRAYGFAILPNLVLMLGTELAPVGSDGQMQPPAHVWQSVVEYTLTGWAFLFMADARQPAKRSPARTARASPLLETGGGGLLGGNRGGGGGGECGVFIPEARGSTAKK